MLQYLICLCLCLLNRLTFKKTSGKMLKSSEKKMQWLEREEEEQTKLGWGGREENDGDGGELLIDSHTRVVTQTDLHTRPQGTLGSVCLSLVPRRVGGFSSTPLRLPVPLIFFCFTVTPSLNIFFCSVSFPQYFCLSLDPSPTCQGRSA